jgi:hypothetical protein
VGRSTSALFAPAPSSPLPGSNQIHEISNNFEMNVMYAEDKGIYEEISV